MITNIYLHKLAVALAWTYTVCVAIVLIAIMVIGAPVWVPIILLEKLVDWVQAEANRTV